MNQALLDVIDLNLVLSGKTIFSDLSLELYPGECLGIVGPSGAGKSMLLRSLAALESCRGEICFQGLSLSDWEIPVYRSQVIYLAQQAVFRPGTVQANLDLPLGWGLHRQRSQPSVDFGELGLAADFGSRQIDMLSGGERQKIALLRALRLQPQILLLDEPTAAMDPDSVLQVERLLLNWLAQGQRGLIWVSHQAQQLERVSQRQFTLAKV